MEVAHSKQPHLKVSKACAGICFSFQSLVISFHSSGIITLLLILLGGSALYHPWSCDIFKNHNETCPPTTMFSSKIFLLYFMNLYRCDLKAASRLHQMKPSVAETLLLRYAVIFALSRPGAGVQVDEVSPSENGVLGWCESSMLACTRCKVQAPEFVWLAVSELLSQRRLIS